MLGRYKMYRGARPPGDPLPWGIRKDTRWNTQHPLRPTQEIVEAYLAAPSDAAWKRFAAAYTALLEARFKQDRAPFDELAAQAAQSDVYLGCSCPTTTNPDVARCHTVLALRFMKKKYPALVIKLPKDA